MSMDVQEKVVALCLNGQTINLCEQAVADTDTREVVQLCKIVLERLNKTEVRCTPQLPRKPPR